MLLRSKILFFFMFFLLVFIPFEISYSQQREEENLSLKLMYDSLNNPIVFHKELIPKNVYSILYFESKLDIGLYIEYPEYYDDEYYPYSKKIDSDTLNLHENYYIVYFDRDFRVLREDYFENYKLFYFLFKFYKDEKITRERVTYVKESGRYSTYDYFYYYEENAELIIKYNDEFIEYINIKYKDENSYIYRSEFYDKDLIKNGIWYYYNDDMVLAKKEYYKDGKLVKYMVIVDLNTIIYYDAKGNTVTKAVFDTITD